EDEGLFGRPPEVDVATGEGAQPLILELPHAPGAAEFGTPAREERLREREDRARVEDREGVERDGPDLLPRPGVHGCRKAHGRDAPGHDPEILSPTEWH